jgi:hypothetical protein
MAQRMGSLFCVVVQLATVMDEQAALLAAMHPLFLVVCAFCSQNMVCLVQAWIFRSLWLVYEK